MQPLSLYAHIAADRQLVAVNVDQVQIFLPHLKTHRAIGTKHLNACTCVVVLGKTAIVLAHISPIPGRYNENLPDIPALSHNHHEQMLEQVAQLVRVNATHFPSVSTAWGVFAFERNGTVSTRPVQSIQQQVERHLRALGFQLRSVEYEQLAAQAVVPPKGELVAFFSRAGDAELYLERKRLWPEENSQTTVSTASATNASTMPPSSRGTVIIAAASTNAPAVWKGYIITRSADGQQATLQCTFNSRRTGLAVRFTQGRQEPEIESNSQTYVLDK